MDVRPFASLLIKSCCLGLLFVTAQISLAQETAGTSEPSRVEIVKVQWKREVRLPRNFDPSVIPTNGAFNYPASMTSVPASSSVTSDAARAASAPRSAGADSNSPFPATPGRLPVFYVYSMKIRNAGSKVIEGIAWDYLFIDPRSKAEVSRRQFLSYVKIAPKKTATLEGQLRTPPIRILRASDSGTSNYTKLAEQGIIQCVLYADNTFWQNAHAGVGVCEFLRNGKILLKQKRRQS